MTELLIGAAALVVGVVGLGIARPGNGKMSKLANSDAAVMAVALTITTLLSLGIGLLATGLYLVAS